MQDDVYIILQCEQMEDAKCAFEIVSNVPLTLGQLTWYLHAVLLNI